MCKVFYNLSFIDENDMLTWCELYSTTKDIFDIIETDEDGGYHVTFGANYVPKYHREVIKEIKAEEALNGKARYGAPKDRASRKPRNKAKAGRGQTAYELFILR